MFRTKSGLGTACLAGNPSKPWLGLVHTKIGLPLPLPLRSSNKGLGRGQGWQEQREPAVILHSFNGRGMHTALLPVRLCLCLETLMTLRGQRAASENTQHRMEKEKEKPSGLGQYT